MILTVTLNLAIDVTYRVARFDRGETSRVLVVGRRAGGKGVNAARVLGGLGREAVVTGLVGGVNGAAARAELARSGMVDVTVTVADESRMSFMVVEDSGEATGFSELGPQVSAAEWQAMLDRFGELVVGAEAVVMSGSLPPGAPVDAYAQLMWAAHRAGVPVLLDADGEALAHGVAAGPDVVKINAKELESFAPGQSLLGGATRLRDAGAQAAVISQGEAGLVALTAAGAWSAAPPGRVSGNPTGAGDAVAAALAVGMVDGTDWPARLADATALSAAAVAAPQAGSFDEADYRRWRGEIKVRRLRSS